QDPAKYPNGAGSAIGPGGFVTFTFGSQSTGGGGGTKDPLATCHKSQLAAGAKMCQSQAKCGATYAKNPAKDPFLAKLTACLDKAGDTFEKAYDKAAQTAVKKGQLCPSADSASDQRDLIASEVASVATAIGEVTPEYDPLWSSWFGAAGTACGSALRAEAA